MTATYFDAVNGSDMGSGSQFDPLKTFAEYLERNPGTSVVEAGETLEFHFLTDMPDTDTVIVSALLKKEASVIVKGHPQTIHSGTLTSFTNRNIPTSQAYEVEDTAFDFTGHEGKLLRFDVGGGDVALTWIAKVISTHRVRVSIIGRLVEGGFPYIIPVTLNGNEAYDLLSLPKLFSAVFDIQGVTDETFAVGPCIVREIEFFDVNFPWLVSPFLAKVTDVATFIGNVYGSQICCFSGFIDTLDGTWIDASSLAVNATLRFLNGDAFSNETFWQNCSTDWQGGRAVMTNTFGLAIFDCTNFAKLAAGASLRVYHDLWGSGNTGNGVELTPDSEWIRSANGGLYATFSGSDIVIDGQTSLPAVDPANGYAFTANRSLTFANLVATVANGGFGGFAFDPKSPRSCIASL